jgi:hypothetical protein
MIGVFMESHCAITNIHSRFHAANGRPAFLMPLPFERLVRFLIVEAACAPKNSGKKR